MDPGWHNWDGLITLLQGWMEYNWTTPIVKGEVARSEAIQKASTANIYASRALSLPISCQVEIAFVQAACKYLVRRCGASGLELALMQRLRKSRLHTQHPPK